MIFSFAGLVMTAISRTDEDNVSTLHKIAHANNHFLFVWCFVGAILLTFSGPFQQTGNGYFAAWAMAVFGVMAIGVGSESMRSAVRGMGSLMGLLASSIIVLIAIAPFVSRDSPDTIYAIVIASVTIVITLAFMFVENEGGRRGAVVFVILSIFALFWIVLACLVTFRGPFLVTGNGYFGSWAGAVSAVFAAVAAHPTPSS